MLLAENVINEIEELDEKIYNDNLTDMDKGKIRFFMALYKESLIKNLNTTEVKDIG